MGSDLGERAGLENPSIVLVAERGLSATKFYKTASEYVKLVDDEKIWLQVWGVHPYALQISTTMDQLMEARFADCLTYQQIVNMLVSGHRDASVRTRGLE